MEKFLTKCLRFRTNLQKMIATLGEKIRHSRQSAICLTVIVGMLLPIIITHLNYPFTTYYLSNLIKSFSMILLCSYMVKQVDSIRLCVLMFLIVISMSLDLASIYSSDLHYSLVDFRYENYLNFSDLYFTYEVLCVLFSAGYYINNWIDDAASWCRSFDYKGLFTRLSP